MPNQVLRRLEDAPEMLRMREVCSILRISKDKGYALVHSGVLPVIRVGTAFRVPRRALLRLLENPSAVKEA